MNLTPFPLDDDSLAQSLREFRPAATPLDPAIVFYRLGMEAGKREAKGGKVFFPTAAAALLLAASLSALVVGPVGYRLGQAASAAPQKAAPDSVPPVQAAPMLAQGDTAPQAAAIATPGSTHPDNHQLNRQSPSQSPPVEPAPLAWPRFRTAMAGWLLGDLLDRPLAGSTDSPRLPYRFDSGGGGGISLADNLRSPHLQRNDPPYPPIDAADPRQVPHHTLSAPRPFAPLRASDWKDVIDLKEIF